MRAHLSIYSAYHSISIYILKLIFYIHNTCTYKHIHIYAVVNKSLYAQRALAMGGLAWLADDSAQQSWPNPRSRAGRHGGDSWPRGTTASARVIGSAPHCRAKRVPWWHAASPLLLQWRPRYGLRLTCVARVGGRHSCCPFQQTLRRSTGGDHCLCG